MCMSTTIRFHLTISVSFVYKFKLIHVQIYIRDSSDDYIVIMKERLWAKKCKRFSDENATVQKSALLLRT